MSDTQRMQVRRLFLAVADLPDDERTAALDRACADDADLRREVEALLAADRNAGGFLANPTAAAPVTGTAPAQPPGERAGAQIDRFKLLEPIGEGGMGVVWMAEQREPVKRRVALKIIKLGMDTRQVIARFEAERQALAMMDHPNIAKVFDAGTTETGRPYFVMEYIRGIPILEYCDQEKLDTGQRLQLFVQVCQAIQHAHQKGVIHRDIKPDNVLVTLHDGVPVPKVIDFGIAKATNVELTAKTLFTEHRQMIGTPAYMSPEQAEMSGLDVDTRSDVYSLGVLLYELLTGTTPFDVKKLLESGFAEMVRTIREVEPHKPSTRVSSLGETASRTAQLRHVDVQRLGMLLRGDLDWIVMKCLEKDRSRRYDTANELADDVLRHLRDEPVVAAAPSAVYRLRKFVRRNRVQTLAVVSVAVSLVVGIVAFAWQAHEARVQQQEAVRQAAVAKAVAEFQTEMLAAADPHRLLGDKVTVLDAMQGAIARLDAGSLSGQPAVEASVRLTVGNTLHSLGRHAEAESNLRKAVQLLRESTPEARADLAFALHCLASTRLAQDDLQDAESLAREALAIARAALPEGHPLTAIVLNVLGGVLEGQHRLDAAAQTFEDALAIRRAAFGEHHPNVAQAANNLAFLLVRQNRLDRAEALLRESLAISRATQPQGHPSIASALENLGQVLLQKADYVEAEAVQREALELLTRAFPDGHQAPANAMQNLAVILSHRGELDEAVQWTRQAVASYRSAFPGGSAVLAKSLGNLGEFLRQQNDLDAAESALRDALDMARRVLPAGHPDLALRANALGLVLEQQNRFDAAESLHTEALTIYRAAYDRPHPNVVDGLTKLGQLLLRRGRLEEAETTLREALAMARACLPEGHPTLGLVLRALAAVRERRGDQEEAEALVRDALEIVRRAFPDGHREIAVTSRELGRMLLHVGELEESEQLHRTALAIERASLPARHPDLARALAGLGFVLMQRGRIAEAEPLLVEASEIVSEALPPENPERSAFAEALGSLRAAQGRADEAETLYREALRLARAGRPYGHPALVASMSRLGELLGRQGRFPEAESLMREALDQLRRTRPSGHPEIASGASNLSWVLMRQGRIADAESLARESLAILRAALPEGHAELARGAHNLGVILLTGGERLEEAEQLLREALAARSRTLPVDDPDVVGTRTRLVATWVARAWRQLDAAGPSGTSDPAAALAFATQAVEATNGAEVAPLQVQAEAQFATGARGDAVASMERALGAWASLDVAQRQELGARDEAWMRSRLERYRD